MLEKVNIRHIKIYQQRIFCQEVSEIIRNHHFKMKNYNKNAINKQNFQASIVNITNEKLKIFKHSLKRL